MAEQHSLLLHPVNINSFATELEGDRQQDGDQDWFFQEDVEPVRVIISGYVGVDDVIHEPTPVSHKTPGNFVRSGTGSVHRRVVSACGTSGYGQLPLWASFLSGGHQDLSASVTNARDRERREMQDLNERLAGYIEKVRFLEAQNRKLAKELENLKNRWGSETYRVKMLYETELSDARKLLDDLDKDKARLEIEVTSLEERMVEALKRVEELENSLKDERETSRSYCSRMADSESMNNYLKRKMSDLESERENGLMKISRLSSQLETTRANLENETLLHIDSENRRQTLEDELAFMKMIHDQEMKELASLVCRDSTAENREYWRSEIDKALGEIRGLFEEQMESFRDDVESSYNWKMQEYVMGMNRQSLEDTTSREELNQMKEHLNEMNFKVGETDDKNKMLIKEIESLRRQRERYSIDQDAEINRLLRENVGLKAQLEALLKELRCTGDDNLSLEKELMAYKKIVEETPGGLKEIFEHEASMSSQEQRIRHPHSIQGSEVVSAETISKDTQSTIAGEMSSKITVQKSSRGSVVIDECDAMGRFVAIENFGSQDECLDGWYLERLVDGEPPFLRYKFNNIIIRPGMEIKVWSSGGAQDQMGQNDLTFEGASWRMGNQSTTTLRNLKGEEKASYVQKSKYS